MSGEPFPTNPPAADAQSKVVRPRTLGQDMTYYRQMATEVYVSQWRMLQAMSRAVFMLAMITALAAMAFAAASRNGFYPFAALPALAAAVLAFKSSAFNPRLLFQLHLDEPNKLRDEVTALLTKADRDLRLAAFLLFVAVASIAFIPVF